MCRLQSVYRYCILFVSHLDGEKLVIPIDYSIGTGERCLERCLPGVGSYEHELGVDQLVWDVGPGSAMGDGRYGL